MTTIILPMAYRRYRHDIDRSSQSERKLPRMTGKTQETDFQLKAKSGEVATHRISPLARGFYSSDIYPALAICQILRRPDPLPLYL